MKWLALALMTLDHVHKYLLGYRVTVLFAMGRSAMLLFAFVLAYNLVVPVRVPAAHYGEPPCAWRALACLRVCL